MALTRADLSNQIQKSTTFPSLMVTDNANEAYWLDSPTHGNGDRIPFYDDSGVVYNHLSVGSGLQISGTVLSATVSSAGYDTIKEEGTTVGAGNNIINFVGSGFTATDEGSGVTAVTLDSTLNALSQFNSNGLLAQTATDTFAARTLTGTTNRITISNADGVSGNPTINVDPTFGSDDLSDSANIMLLNNSQTVTGVKTFNVNVVLNGTPTLDSHGVNKGYVDRLVLDRKGTKVDVATTGNISLSGEQTLDGYLTSVSKVLVKDQTDPAENGYYTSAAGAWSRTSDMDAANEVQGSLALVANGGQQGQIWYTLSQVTTLGTDDIDFIKLATGVIDGSGNPDQITVWADTDTLTSSSTFKFASNQLVIGDTAYVSGSVMTTKGSTANSSGYGWVHKDSSGNIVVRVDNTGSYRIGNSNEVTHSITGTTISTGDYLIITNNGDLNLGASDSVHIQGGGTTSTIPSLLADITRNDLSNNQSNVKIAGTFSPSGAGTNTFTDLDIVTVVNQTTHTGNSYSINIHPTLTSVLGDYTALRITVPNENAIHVTQGLIRFDFGGDASYDMIYRHSGGYLTRLGNGTTGQVLLATTNAAPSWGAAPVAVSEAYLENSTSSVVDLDSGTSVKDVDGNNIAFTVPSDLKKFHIYRGGIHQSMSGNITSRDYTVNTSTHVVTFTTALTADEIVKFVKFE